MTEKDKGKNMQCLSQLTARLDLGVGEKPEMGQSTNQMSGNHHPIRQDSVGEIKRLKAHAARIS